MPVTFHKVPSSKILDHTVKEIKDLAWKHRGNPGIKKLAVWICRQAGISNGRNKQNIARAVSKWVGENVRYFNDPHRLETLQSPQQTLTRLYGDCDDMAVLQAALLMSLGLPVRFRVVGRSQPEHIYVETYIPLSGWVGFDPASIPGDPHPSKLTTFRLDGYGGLSYANYRKNQQAGGPSTVRRNFSGP